MSKLSVFSDAIADLVQASSLWTVSLERTRVSASATAWANDLAVTAAHVLGPVNDGTVRTASGDRVSAQVLGRDPSTDLALLRISGGWDKPPTWRDTEARVGELVIALARSVDGPQATLGMIQESGPAWRTRGGSEIDHFIEVNTALPRGFSGGPLMDMHGSMMGLNTHALSAGGTTIPTSTIKRVVESLATHGRVRRGHLGLGVQPVALPKPLATDVNREHGCLVTSVESGGPADQAGVQIGDVLLVLDGRALDDPETLRSTLGFMVDRNVQLDLSRGGQRRSVAVEVRERSPKR